ncbi:hypothetical protein NW767_014880, partial [Fusarium falciforme]
FSVGGCQYKCHLDGCAMEHKVWSRADNFRQHLLRIHGKKYDADDDLSMYDCRKPPLWDLDRLSVPSTRWQTANPIQQKLPRAGNDSSGSELRGRTESMPVEEAPQDNQLHMEASGSQGPGNQESYRSDVRMADADDTPDEIPTPPVQAMKDSASPSLTSAKQIVDGTPKYCIKGNLKDYSARSKNDAQKRDVTFSTSQEKKGHECTVCRKTFYRKSILKKHLKRHAKPYSCTFLNCESHFGSKHDWKRHESRQHCQVEKDCNRDGGFWCGFCTKMIEISYINELENAWAKRCDHIDDHFCGRGQSVKHISEWKHEDPSGTKASSRPHEAESDSLLGSEKSGHKSRHGPKANAKPERGNKAQPKPEDIKSYGGVDYTRRENSHLGGMLVSQGNMITINGEEFMEYRVLAKIGFA